MSTFVAPLSSSEQRALNLFRRHYADCRRHVDAQSRVWNELIDAYLGNPGRTKPTGDDAWKSFVFFKYAYQQVQTLVPELASDDDADFVWEPRNPRMRDHADTVSGLTSYQLERDDYVDKRMLSVIIAALYGACPVKSSWAYEVQERNVRNSRNEKDRVRVLLRDDPTATIVPPTDFAYDLRPREAKKWRYVYHRMRLTMEELEQPQVNGEPLYDLERLKHMVEGDIRTNWSETTDTTEGDYVGEIERAREQGIEIVEMWTPTRLIVVAPQFDCVLRDCPNPFDHGRIPFDLVTLLPTHDGVWGQPMLWLLRDIQEFIWSLDNAAMDALKLQIDPPMAMDPEAAKTNGQRRGMHPGKQFVTKAGAEVVQPIRVAGIEHFASTSAIENYEQRAKKITGLTDEVAGQSQADSATQAAINQRQAKGRIGIMLRLVDRGWARVAEKFLQLDQQFLDTSKPHRITGKDGWRNVTLEEIAGMWDVRPKNTSERVVQELDRQNKLEALAAFTPLAETITADGHAINLTPFLRGAAEAFKFDPDEVVVKLDEKLQTDAHVAAAQQIMQQQMQPQFAPDMGGMPGMPVDPSMMPPPGEEPPVDPSTGRAAGQLAFGEATAPQPEDLPVG